MIAELDATNADDTTPPVLRKTYLWDPSEPVATRVLAMSCFDETGNYVEDLYYTHDALKNTTALFGILGGRRASYSYGAYGQTLAMDGNAAADNPFRFSSEYFDEELGMISYNYRHYNPLDGRWITRDPIGEEGGLNVYGFVGNLPTSFLDQLGLDHSVEVDKENCTITIHIEYVVYARKGDERAQSVLDDKVREIKSTIENEWNGFNKGCCAVIVDVSILKSTKYKGSRLPDILRIIPSKIVGGKRNVIELSSDPELIGQTYVNYGKYMYLSIDAVPWTVAHETGHIMGLRDSYIQEGHGKYRTTRPAKGKEGRMMSQVGGKVHPEEIDKLVEGIKCPCGESQEIRKNR